MRFLICTSSQANLSLAFLFRHTDVGAVDQGYIAVFPTLHDELFPTNTLITPSALPVIYAAIASPTPCACGGQEIRPDVQLGTGCDLP